MRALSREEQALFDEMKQRCLIKGQYTDKNAKNKFKMLCRLEDFEIQYWELLAENKQLKERINYLERSNNRREDIISEQKQEINDSEDNWNKLKEYVKENLYFYSGLQGEDLETDYSMQLILDKMQELEGIDINDQISKNN